MKALPPLPKRCPSEGTYLIHYKGDVYQAQGHTLRVEGEVEVWDLRYNSDKYPGKFFSRPIDDDFWQKFTAVPRGTRVWHEGRWLYIDDYASISQRFVTLFINSDGRLQHGPGLTSWEVNSGSLCYEQLPEEYSEECVVAVNRVRTSCIPRFVDDLTPEILGSELLLIPGRQYLLLGQVVTLEEVVLGNKVKLVGDSNLHSALSLEKYV